MSFDKLDRIALTKRYLKSVLQYRVAFAGMIFCMVMVGLLQPAITWLIAPLLDSATEQKEYAIAASYLPLLMFLLILAFCIFTYGAVYLSGWLSQTLQRDYRLQMGRQLLDTPLSSLEADTSGTHTARFMLFLPRLTASTHDVLLTFVQAPVKITAYLAVLFYWHWQLTLIVLTAAPVLVWIVIRLSKRMKIISQRVQQEAAASQSHLNEIIANSKMVKLSGKEIAHQRLYKTFTALRGYEIRTQIILAMGRPLSQIIIGLAVVVVVYFLMQELVNDSMTAGEVAGFLTMLMMLQHPVRQIPRAFNKWDQMLVAAREIYNFIDSSPEQDAGNYQVGRVQGQINFCDVVFSYPTGEMPAINHLSLTIQAGERVALVGRSGSGKSTLCSLLPRFYEPQQGSIELDGINIRDYQLDCLRQQFSLVTQKPLLFNDTVAMNVAFPYATVDADKLKQSLSDAAAMEFVSHLSEGIDTVIGENGSTLSGGQQQRLMLARAFYRDAPIIILDESTSALDSNTEDQIKQSLNKLLVGRTAIIIAHRFSTLDTCDKIIVLDNGTVLDAGSAPQLLQTCPLFADMSNKQNIQNGHNSEMR